jgi:hypothetical protein
MKSRLRGSTAERRFCPAARRAAVSSQAMRLPAEARADVVPDPRRRDGFDGRARRPGDLGFVSPMFVRIAAATALVAIYGHAGEAAATPTQTRIGGAESQGPATRALSALHHNPAMLAGMPGTRVQGGLLGGLDQRWIRRFAVGPDGAPEAALGERESLIDPVVGYFGAASFYFEPFAVGIGAYDVGGQYDLQSSDRLRYHLAPDPDRPAALCRGGDAEACKVNGGAASQRTDITLAVAWNILSNLRIGVGVHLPRLRTRFAQDNSRVLSDRAPPDEGKCAGVEAGSCAERLGFSGVTTWLPSRDGRPTGFDLALTFGLAVDVSDRVTFGMRYRTRPLVNGGDYVLAGQAVVCRPDESEQGADDVQPCSVATPVAATLREGGAREVAVGAAFVLGRSKLWRIDGNLYWLDLCHDTRNGAGIVACGDPGDQRLSLVGLDRGGALATEAVRYRGRADVSGADAYTTYRARSFLALMVGGHISSPGTRPSAMTAASSDAWRFGLTFGTTLRIAQSNFQIVPGYGFDLYLPTTVRDGAFDPTAAAAFYASGADLNTPDADLVLAGRGRPSNAGRYTGAVHTVMLGLRWSERVIGFE